MTILGVILLCFGIIQGCVFITRLVAITRGGGTVSLIPAYVSAACIAVGVFLLA